MSHAERLHPSGLRSRGSHVHAGRRGLRNPDRSAEAGRAGLCPAGAAPLEEETGGSPVLLPCTHAHVRMHEGAATCKSREGSSPESEPAGPCRGGTADGGAQQVGVPWPLLGIAGLYQRNVGGLGTNQGSHLPGRGSATGSPAGHNYSAERNCGNGGRPEAARVEEGPTWKGHGPSWGPGEARRPALDAVTRGMRVQELPRGTLKAYTLYGMHCVSFWLSVLSWGLNSRASQP